VREKSSVQWIESKAVIENEINIGKSDPTVN